MITERGSVVLVLSAAVLVIVIDARDVGWTGLARAGGAHGGAEARRFCGRGFLAKSQSRKGWWRGWWDHEIHEWHEKRRYWSYSYASVVVLVLGAAVLGLQRSGTRIAAGRVLGFGGSVDWGEWLSGDGGGFVEGTLV